MDKDVPWDPKGCQPRTINRARSEQNTLPCRQPNSSLSYLCVNEGEGLDKVDPNLLARCLASLQTVAIWDHRGGTDSPIDLSPLVLRLLKRDDARLKNINVTNTTNVSFKESGSQLAAVVQACLDVCVIPITSVTEVQVEELTEIGCRLTTGGCLEWLRSRDE